MPAERPTELVEVGRVFAATPITCEMLGDCIAVSASYAEDEHGDGIGVVFVVRKAAYEAGPQADTDTYITLLTEQFMKMILDSLDRASG